MVIGTPRPGDWGHAAVGREATTRGPTPVERWRPGPPWPAILAPMLTAADESFWRERVPNLPNSGDTERSLYHSPVRDGSMYDLPDTLTRPGTGEWAHHL